MSEKQSFIDKVRQQLEDWDYQLDRFEHRVQDLSHDIQDKAKEKLAEFKETRS